MLDMLYTFRRYRYTEVISLRCFTLYYMVKPLSYIPRNFLFGSLYYICSSLSYIGNLSPRIFLFYSLLYFSLILSLIYKVTTKNFSAKFFYCLLSYIYITPQKNFPPPPEFFFKKFFLRNFSTKIFFQNFSDCKKNFRAKNFFLYIDI